MEGGEKRAFENLAWICGGRVQNAVGLWVWVWASANGVSVVGLPRCSALDMDE